MTPAQQRAMAIGVELVKALRVRSARAPLMQDPRQFTPAAWSGYLMGTAALERYIDGLRRLLADQLEATASEQPARLLIVTQGPLAWGPGGLPRGRHAKP